MRTATARFDLEDLEARVLAALLDGCDPRSLAETDGPSAADIEAGLQALERKTGAFEREAVLDRILDPS